MFNKAEQLHEQQKYVEANAAFEKIVGRYPGQQIAIRAAQKIAEISLFKLEDFARSLKFNRYIIINSKNDIERVKAQKNIAKIVFENLSDYRQAIIEYNKLVENTSDIKERHFAQKRIARSYYFLDHFYQAKKEVEQLLASSKNDSDQYEMNLLLGNIHLAQKEIDSAIDVFNLLLNKYPERAQKDNISLHLAICYEEKNDFARAIEVLDEMKEVYQTPAFISERINKLKSRQLLQPGAKGLKK